MNRLFRLKSYINYFLDALDEHSLHAPFIYEFYTTVIKPDRKEADFDRIEAIRKKLKQDDRKIKVNDYGTGESRSNTRKISRIANTSLTHPKYNRLLKRIADYCKPEITLELGTSLGINAMYLASSKKQSKVISMEGSESLIEIAQSHFQKLNFTSIEIIEGNIDQQLPKVIDKFKSLDIVFIDANHRYEAVINYFDLCFKKAGEESIFIIDDIRWSRQMYHAWKTIKSKPEVSVSIDLFQIGILIFKPNIPKQDYILYY